MPNPWRHRSQWDPNSAADQTKSESTENAQISSLVFPIIGNAMVMVVIRILLAVVSVAGMVTLTKWGQMTPICISWLDHHWFRKTACRLFGVKPLSEPRVMYCQLGPKEHISMKYYSSYISADTETVHTNPNWPDVCSTCCLPSWKVRVYVWHMITMFRTKAPINLDTVRCLWQTRSI